MDHGYMFLSHISLGYPIYPIIIDSGVVGFWKQNGDVVAKTRWNHVKSTGL